MMPFVRRTSSQKFSHQFFINTTLIVLALMGFISVLVATRWGVGTSPDSVVYIAGARNLAAGRGYSTVSESGVVVPITHHAPFYSFILATLDVLGLDPIQGARWLNAFLLSGIILLVGYVLRELLSDPADKIDLMPLLGAAFVLVSVAVLEIHIMAWTEALFLLLSFSGLWVLSRYLDGGRFGLLIGSAILISMAFLTRYIGVVLVATGGLSILVFSSRSFKARLRDTFTFGIIATAPMLIWLLRNILLRGTAANREFFYHPITRQQIGWGITTLGSWLNIADSASGWVKLLPYIVFGAAFIGLVINNQKRASNGKPLLHWLTLSSLPVLIRILIVFILLYCTFLFFSLTFLDANTPLDSRILSPVMISLVILVLYTIAEGMKSLSIKTALRYLLTAAGFLLLVTFVSSATDFVNQSSENGVGFTSRWWRASPTLSAMKDYPSGQVIYSNAPEAFYLYADRNVRSMPRKFNHANQVPNGNYTTELMALKEQIQDKGAVIVYFDSMTWPTLPSAQELLDDLGLDVLEQTADGIIYGIEG